MKNAETKMESMQSDMNEKFNKNDILKADFEREKIRMFKVKKFI